VSVPVVAAFDVDRTVTVRDCVVPFLNLVGGRSQNAGRLVRRAHLVIPAAARRDRDLLKAVAARTAFAGVPEARVAALAQTFGDDVVRRGLRGDVVARIRWHQSEGHAVVFVSASFEVYLEVIGGHLGVDGVLGTRLAVDADGVLTGELVGANCRGAEKVRRLHAWLGERYGGRDAVTVWAYGDSAGDRALLADADHPVWAAGRLGSVAPA
jgi:phosphatidylglycerophosphatase C